IDEVDRWIDVNPLTRIDHAADDEPQHRTQRRTHEADQDPLREEDPADRRPGEPHGEQDADLPGLVPYHHRERSHDIEGRHDTDEEYEKTQAELSELQRGEQRRVLRLPVEHPVGIAEPGLELLTHP